MRAPFLRRIRSLRFIPLAVALLGVALIMLGVSGATFRMADAHSASDRPPGGVLTNPVVRTVDIASPAVVRIATIYKAHVTFDLCGEQITLPASGEGYVVGGLGSGAFISSHGDILTAGHVVDIDTASLDQEIFQDDPRAQQDIADALNSLPCAQFTPPLRAIDIANGYVQYAGIPYQTSYSQPQRLVWRDTSYTGPLSVSPQDNNDILTGLEKAPSLTAQVIVTSSFQQDDVALLHVNLDDTPSITLDDSSTVAVLDPITVIGFPGNGDATGDPTNLLTPSVNTASVSAIKTNDDGAQLIQVGGNIEHGDSGGPALDAQGHIIGIVSFGGSDTQGITAFLRSSDSARRLIDATTINMQPGAFERKWQQAFSDYAATKTGHWHTAARELDALAAAYPDFKGVLPYKTFADTAAETEAVPNTRPSFDFILIGSIAALVIGLALLGGLLFVLWRRSRPRPAYAPAPATRPLTPGYPSAPGNPQYPAYPSGPSSYNSYPAYPAYPAYSGYASPAYGYPAPPTLPPGAIRLGAESPPPSMAPSGSAGQPEASGIPAPVVTNGGSFPTPAPAPQQPVERVPVDNLTLSELNAAPMGRMTFNDEPPRK